jgi:enolase-phosphatase E1
VVIYSSGSVEAQKLLFRHTDWEGNGGDMTGMLAGYFDTVNAGPKTDKESYRKIAEALGVPEGEWLFLSDNTKEVQAALEAGMDAAVVVRSGNKELTEEEKAKYKVLINGFEEVTEWALGA